LRRLIVRQQRRATLARSTGSRRAVWLSLAGAACIAGQPLPASAAMFWEEGFGSRAWSEPGYERTIPMQRHSVPRKRRAADPADPDKKGNELAIKAGQSVLQAVISIRDQELTLYADGVPVAHSQVATGVPDHPTPTGIFSVIDKERYHTSNIYSGAPMPFMQRLTMSGVAMHLGDVPGGRPASHGCIRLPESFARRLWGTTEVGARVLIVHDETAPVPFESERLFALRRPEPPLVASLQAAPPASEITGSAGEGASDEKLLAPDDRRAKSDPARLAAAEIPTRPILRSTIDASEPGPAPAKPSEPQLKSGPISVFISRQEGRLFVRKGFEPVLDVPVMIERPDQPLGTHLYTALGFKDDGVHLRWNLVTMPAGSVIEREAAPSRGSRRKAEREAPVIEAQLASSAADALARIAIPEDAVQRISELMSPGASLIISDHGLGRETKKYTDFIVVTR
jgi:lipoprotein-anchoring transpeptidase ErfK/SrfK